MVTMTQATKVLAYLEKGNTLTAKQAASRFKIKNLRARISELREEGYTINNKPIVYRDTGAHGVAYELVQKKARKASSKKA
jgi:hypothetical protein